MKTPTQESQGNHDNWGETLTIVLFFNQRGRRDSGQLRRGAQWSLFNVQMSFFLSSGKYGVGLTTFKGIIIKKKTFWMEILLNTIKQKHVHRRNVHVQKFEIYSLGNNLCSQIFLLLEMAPELETRGSRKKPHNKPRIKTSENTKLSNCHGQASLVPKLLLYLPRCCVLSLFWEDKWQRDLPDHQVPTERTFAGYCIIQQWPYLSINHTQD